MPPEQRLSTSGKKSWQNAVRSESVDKIVSSCWRSSRRDGVDWGLEDMANPQSMVRARPWTFDPNRQPHAATGVPVTTSPSVPLCFPAAFVGRGTIASAFSTGEYHYQGGQRKSSASVKVSAAVLGERNGDARADAPGSASPLRSIGHGIIAQAISTAPSSLL